MIKIKRVYEVSSEEDGFRILIDRLWPRGLSKESAKIDAWLKDIAPSDDLRKWFSHDPKKWTDFKKKYREELKRKRDTVSMIRSLEKEKKIITFLYSAKNKEYNNAVFLQEYMQK
ncbi:putative uroporphyrin-III c-methyltransferase [Candidatus Nitrosotalea sp. TS]|uniref:DUF488 domain-containing protein n=1 Tax=Candidatus Nitrosotalea sp. TS TaxID=2341020 RepID=UPI0014096284|nr:DUF488 family protein [Candidatus Nitrosotalea sp. TS]NHI03131.1 putative uroporphyrin-III c-methyltransferase [Candidatus Nitrosotalea sp. TS]